MTDDAPVHIRPEIASLAPYRQGKPAGDTAFKLSSNENPFGPLPRVREVLASESSINRYPDALATRLRHRLAERFSVTLDEIHVGAGSVAILTQLVQATAGPGDEVIYAWRSFEAYPGMVRVAGATAVEVPLTADGRHDLPAMAAAVTERTRAIMVCTPNNPTGPAVTDEEFREFVRAVPSRILIMLDEAYGEFVTDPAAINGRSVIRQPGFENVVVLRTFSKAFGLAALRVGYAIGHHRILDAARSTAIPLSVTAQAEVAALASLDDEAELLQRVEVIVQRRTRLRDGLIDAGWQVPDAQGNFVWLATGEQTQEAAEQFADAGLVVRAFAGDGLRISVGEEESVDLTLRVAGSFVRNLPERHPARR